MKRLYVILGCLLGSLVMFAQGNMNQIFSYNIVLYDGETFDVEAAFERNPYASLEGELAYCMATRIQGNALLRSISGEHLKSSLERKMGELITSMKTNDAPVIFVEADSAYSSYYHKMARNANFREFVKSRVLELLKETCRMYPTSYRELLLDKIDETSLLLSEMQRHNYQIINKKLYKNNILQANGRTLEGWIIRRVLTDGIPVSEMRAFLKTARKIVGDSYRPEKPAYVAEYCINGVVMCNISTNGTSGYFMVPKSKVELENLISIRRLSDATGDYYLIRSFRIDKSGERREKSVLYKENGEMVQEIK